ncbi:MULTISPECIES: hypothetical protein [unclassified Streptomyces]|uniref:hypothetical protein n=1 Tax=unclassified Streptomyces TaxID=2593676 RepID=UPI0022B732DA|nr:MULTISPECIES: hypothetical protein [unclassified Streptomyces]MCZ7416254.1 hypothetical protein [Streptomyces sp. WMMC897]MCZ7433936.1 hypothetical protein [Streptomyces sp. WMMC1477]
MLPLRLIRGSRALTQLPRLTVAAAAAGVGFLLLSALSYALAHPGDAGVAVPRLLWCLVPLAATVHLALVVARTDPGPRSRAALDALGLRTAGLPLLSAVQIAACCLLGSGLALLVFLYLRGDVVGLPFDGAAGELLAAGRPVPLVATVTLLLTVPLAAAGASALSLRAAAARRPASPQPVLDRPGPRPPLPAGLPYGVGLVGLGLALEAFAARDAAGVPPGVIVGWLLTALGLALAGPGLTRLTGRLLAAFRPGATRLLAGRFLQEEATLIGAPIGVLCAAGCGGVAALYVYGPDDSPGPLAVLGGAVVVLCALTGVLTAAAGARTALAPARAALAQLGASRELLRRAAALRAASVLVVLVPVTWGVARLAALPLS